MPTDKPPFSVPPSTVPPAFDRAQGKPPEDCAAQSDTPAASMTAMTYSAPTTRRYTAERLEDELQTLAGGFGQVVSHREVPWSSITFTGARHTLMLSYSGTAQVDGGEAMIAALPDHEFTIPGQLVADASVMLVEHALMPEPVMRVAVELLLLEDV